MSDLISLIISIIVLIVAYFVGSEIEKNHFKKLREREIKLSKFPTTSIGNKLVNNSNPIEKMELVSGCVVIASDHFKDFVASFKAIFGGRLRSYETLIERARREAILRMRESAQGATLIINTKLETTVLNDHVQNEPAQIAVIAYGTAITYQKEHRPSAKLAMKV